MEVYWNPGDWRPVKVGYLPRPWGLRIPNPLFNREDGAFFAPFRVERLMKGTALFKQGDYDRNPVDNSQVGVRFSGVFSNGLQVGLHYFYQRWAGDDGSPFSPVRGITPDADGQVRTQALVGRGTLPVEYITPYIHTVGLSANYFEGNWTQCDLPPRDGLRLRHLHARTATRRRPSHRCCPAPRGRTCGRA